jgi:hypothetical protein
VYVVEEKARTWTPHKLGSMHDIQGVEEDHGHEGGGFGGREGELTIEHRTTWNTGMEQEEEKVPTPMQTTRSVGGGEGRATSGYLGPDGVEDVTKREVRALENQGSG